MVVKKISLLAAFIVLAHSSFGYSDLSLEVLIKVSEDGTAHVTEKTTIFMNTQSELESFDYTVLVGASIADWTRFSRNVRYHVNGPVAAPRIAGRRMGTNTGMIILEYDLASPIFSINQTGSRLKTYALNEGVLGFDSSRAGETIISKGTVLTIEIPVDAQLVSFSPPASSIEKNTLSWSATHGSIVGSWKLVFLREKSLSSEVNEFFVGFYEKIISLVPPLILLVIVVLVAYKFMRKK